MFFYGVKYCDMKSKCKKMVELSTPGIKLGKRLFFKDFHFEWNPGEFWAVVGPNGCGKSIFLRLISGDYYDLKTDVDYGFDGKNGNEPESLIRTVSLEEQRNLLSDLEVYVQMRWNSIEEDSTPMVSDWLSQDSIEGVYPDEIFKRSAASKKAYTKRFSQYVDMLNIEHLVSRRIAELSNGEMRRTFLARSLIANPKIILLDAPFMGLDTASRDLLTNVMDELSQYKDLSLMIATTSAEDVPSSVNMVLEFGECGNVVYCGTRENWKHEEVKRKNSSSKRNASVDSVEVSNDLLLGPTVGDVLHKEDVDEHAKKIVEINNLCISYGENVVFKDFNWTIRQGECWSLVGENGSGKSTLIALIIGDHMQGYGNDIRIFGRKRGTGESIWDIKSKMGWVSPELHACMDGRVTVADSVLAGYSDTPYATGRYTKRQREKMLDLLSEFGLLEKKDEYFGSLSGGEQRLVLLARALIKNPPLLVLDEPCQNLDKKNIIHFSKMVDKACECRDVSLIYVSHLRGTIPSCVKHRMKLSRSVKE